MINDEPKEALPLYRKAQEIVTACGEADTDLTHNVLLATMASGDPITVEDAATLTQWKTGAFLTKEPILIDRLNTLYALACVYGGDADGAKEALQAVDCANPRSPT